MESMRLAEKLPMLMNQRGLKAADLARLTGIPSQRFTEWKDATPDRPRAPTLAQALRVARALGVSLDYLADDEQDQPPTPAVTDEERVILDMVHTLGVAEAKRRLLQALPPPPAGIDIQPGADIPAARREVPPSRKFGRSRRSG